MLKKIMNIVNITADIIIVMGIFIITILLMTKYIVDNRFDDDNFYALITAVIAMKLIDRLENNVKKIGKEKETKEKES